MSPAELAEAADENLVVHATAATKDLVNARVRNEPDLVLVDSGLACDTFNLVCRARLDPARAPARIDDALAFFAEPGHPFSWWLGPGFMPATLPRLLEAANLEAADSELAMALDLSAMQSLGPTPDGLVIRRVRTASDLAAFTSLSAANWSPPDPNVTHFYTAAASRLLDDRSPQWLYLGLVDGRPVATAELTIGGGVAGLYNISTEASQRGRGIGTAMTAAPLEDARRAGLAAAILQAAPAGVGIYQRLGFRQFGVVIEYKPPAPLSATS